MRFIATIVSLALGGAAMFATLVMFFGYGLTPCVPEDGFMGATRFALPLALAGSAIWLGVLKRQPNLRALVIALAIPAVALAAHWQARQWNAARQERCARQTLEQAMASCRADTAVYRRSADGKVLTLVTPGEVDKAWNCLVNWATHNRSISVTIDESVFAARR
jgi:hypothetical protein